MPRATPISACVGGDLVSEFCLGVQTFFRWVSLSLVHAHVANQGGGEA